MYISISLPCLSYKWLSEKVLTSLSRWMMHCFGSILDLIIYPLRDHHPSCSAWKSISRFPWRPAFPWMLPAGDGDSRDTGRAISGMGDFGLRTPHWPCQISLEIYYSLKHFHSTLLPSLASSESREISLTYREKHTEEHMEAAHWKRRIVVENRNSCQICPASPAWECPLSLPSPQRTQNTQCLLYPLRTHANYYLQV